MKKKIGSSKSIRKMEMGGGDPNSGRPIKPYHPPAPSGPERVPLPPKKKGGSVGKSKMKMGGSVKKSSKKK